MNLNNFPTHIVSFHSYFCFDYCEIMQINCQNSLSALFFVFKKDQTSIVFSAGINNSGFFFYKLVVQHKNVKRRNKGVVW